MGKEGQGLSGFTSMSGAGAERESRVGVGRVGVGREEEEGVCVDFHACVVLRFQISIFVYSSSTPSLEIPRGPLALPRA